ncbi:PAS domain S-box protein [Magnetospirillum sp. UT-4]|uniref:two-component system response regulator n=1 Tax=Magnetospirillum sp. UT-4 TaxID=2681467 RepID=UPI001380FF8F|nr:PAS domain S-box protein [Magnetospirillum sp. UT-4]CAA7615091.1 putative Diguanylate cyclase [Magnetospirillum sp. UT-4]
MTESQKIILLVEDSDIDGTIILGRLSKFPELTCHWVHSLAACREMLAVISVDAILLDLNLDDAAGPELIEAVRGLCNAAPIVILTNTDDERTSLMALQSGCEDYLVKVKSDGQTIRRTLLYSMERSRLDLARRTAEETARQREALADLILEIAPEAMLVIDRGGRVVRANQHACQVFGYAADGLVGRDLDALVPQDARRHHHERVARFTAGPAASGLRIPSEVRGLRRDGREFPAEVNLAPLWFDDEAYVVVSVRDLTLAKAAEAASRLNGAIFEHAREGLMITDGDGVVLSVNPAFTAITGFEADEAVGASVGFMKSGRHDPAYYRQMWHSLTGEGHWAGEIWNMRRDGSVGPFWLSISAVRNADGRISNYVAIYTDIADMKRHEEALHHMAYHDALTGLPNRSLLGDRMRQSLAKARRSGRMLAVAYIDLDGFKPINDAQGHHAGDMLLTEVVETAALEDVERARDVLQACRAMGVSSALDDFGTGYSSLTYLRHLPIDTLKIDRSFVWNLTDDAEDLTIVQGVIVLANGFGREVLAEGIEKAEHGEILLRLGCQLGQGYRIAPPMPANDFLAWRAAWRPDNSWTA